MSHRGSTRPLPRLRPIVVPLLLVTGYALLALAWAIGNAPFLAPDESQHYIRAVGVSQGTLIGEHAVYSGPRMATPEGTAWRHKLTRAVPVPAGLSPRGLDCAQFRPHLTPQCADGVRPNPTQISEQTDVGRYGPFPYLLPALVVSRADDAVTGGYYGRLAVMALWLALLAAATWMLWDPRSGAASLAGLVVAVTPVVVFTGASLGNSGPEIIASVAFFSALLRLTRPNGEGVTRAAWLVAGGSGAILILSRSLGPVWLLCGLVVAVVAAEQETVRRAIGRHRSTALVTMVLVGLALAGAASWELIYGPRVGATLVPTLSAFKDGLYQLRGAYEGLFGWFGYQDVRMSIVGPVVWTIMAGALLALAAQRGTAGERRALVLAVALGALVPLYIYMAVTRHQGIATMGRHLLPLLVIVPLLSGEVVRRRVPPVERGWARVVFPALLVAGAAVHLLGWWENSRRYARAGGADWLFATTAEWNPPAGWWVWIAVTTTGIAAFLVTAALSLRGRDLNELRAVRKRRAARSEAVAHGAQP